MKIEEYNENTIIIIKKELLHSDIQEFADLKNQIAKCVHKMIGKKKRDITNIFVNKNEGE